MTLADFLGRMLDMVLMWVPSFVIVKTTHGGCKWTRGADVQATLCDNGMWWPKWCFLPGLLRPWRWLQWDNWWRQTGLHWYWPLVTEAPTLVPLPVQTCDFRRQMLTTKDRKTIYAKGVLRYEVIDPVALLTKCIGYDEIFEDEGTVSIAAVVCEKSFDGIAGNLKETATSLSVRLRRELSQYGIRVVRLQLSDFATGDGLIHMTDWNSPVISEEI